MGHKLTANRPGRTRRCRGHDRAVGVMGRGNGYEHLEYRLTVSENNRRSSCLARADNRPGLSRQQD